MNKTSFRLPAVLALLLAVTPVPVPAVAQDIEEVTVTGRRLPPLLGDDSYAVVTLDSGDIGAAASSRLDEILRDVPGFGLFRRASSLSAHPTTQGVTLRALGPNGAGRTLVLLDGIPLNDPFGGWVYWSALSPGSIDTIRVTKGGGAGRWGSQALAGVIELTSSSFGETGVSADARYGNHDTAQISGRATMGAGDTRGFVEASHFRSDGYFLLPADQRGSIDVPAASEATHISAGLRRNLGAGTTLTIRAGYFREERTNGLSLSTNLTEAFDASFSLVHDGVSGADWQLAAWVKDRDFANSFAAARDERSSERVVLDQFDVPAIGWGANGLGRFGMGAATTLEVGFDLRRLSGETNERFRNLGAGFTRGRRAGGDQLIAGGYLELSHQAGPGTVLSAGVRLDAWRAFAGQRLESDLADGAVLRDDDIPNRDGVVPTGRLGLRHELTPGLAVRLAAYSGFRLPTINEFYRPFRVRNDITEANPALLPERLYGFDIGLEYAATDGLRLELGYFRNWLHQGVGNVTLALGPGFFPPTGFVPAGGSLRQRTNIDRIVADGVEISAALEPAGGLKLSASYLYVNARVTASAVAPALAGLRLAGSPRHQGNLVLRYNPAGPWSLSAALRFAGKQFDDDLNSRLLDGFVTAALRGAYRLGERAEIYAAAENLFDTRIQSALSGEGLVTLGQPRLWSLGIRVTL